MLDWIRYFPIKLRDDNTKKGLAKGPYFRKCLPMSITMGDNTLYLKIPRQNKVWQPFGVASDDPEVYSPYRRDILTEKVIDGYFGPLDNIGRWSLSSFLRRQWLLLSPWFGGRQLYLNMFGDVVIAPKEARFTQSSFFHPRVFESALAEYLDSRFGDSEQRGHPVYSTPVNWRPNLSSENLCSVRFDVDNNFSAKISLTKYDLFAFPITSQKFIVFSFDVGGGNIPGSDKKDSQEAVKLLEEIMASIKVELGPQTRAEIEKVKQTCPDMSLTKEFGILKWPIKPEDVGKAVPPTDSSEPMPLPKS